MRLFVMAAACVLMAAPSYADTVKLVVGFPPGGSTDVLARLLAPKLERELGESVVVENVPGASGMIAFNRVAGAEPDGRTILVTPSATMVVAPHTLRSFKGDVFADVAPVAHLMEGPMVFAVNANQPFKTLREYVTAARTSPQPFLYAVPGKGTVPHLIMHEFMEAIGVRMTPVFYAGFGPVAQDLCGGHVAAGIIPPLSVSPCVRPLAVSGASSLEALKDVPTLESVGLGASSMIWNAAYAPARTPREIVEKLNAAFISALKETRVDDLGFAPTGTSPEGLAAIQRQDYDRWGKVAKDMQLQ